MKKNFKLKATEIRQLVNPMGYCYATDKITVEGMLVGYFYREETEDQNDSGWRFFSGTETQDYVDDPINSGIYDVNTIANYDRSIIPYLQKPFGIEIERSSDSNRFTVINE